MFSFACFCSQEVPRFVVDTPDFPFYVVVYIALVFFGFCVSVVLLQFVNFSNFCIVGCIFMISKCKFDSSVFISVLRF